MLYLFYGSDTDKVRAKAFEWVAKARTKEPNLAYTRLAREELTSSALLEAATSNSLFAKRTLTLLDDPFLAVQADTEDESDAPPTVGRQTSNMVEDYLDMLAESENAIVILAPKLPVPKAKKLAAKAKMAYEFSLRLAPSQSRGFNSNLVNALGARSREKLWLEINRALRTGDPPEQLHGLLHWKARDLMGKSDFPKKWSPAEARKLSMDLITLLQNSRRGGLDLSLSLERFALTI